MPGLIHSHYLSFNKNDRIAATQRKSGIPCVSYCMVSAHVREDNSQALKLVNYLLVPRHTKQKITFLLHQHAIALCEVFSV